MKLSQSNRFLQDKTLAMAGLVASARTSSGIEGIRQPFERAIQASGVTDVRSFSEYWKQRVASKSAK